MIKDMRRFIPDMQDIRRFRFYAIAIGAVVAVAGLAYIQHSSQPSFITAPVERGIISTSVKATGAVDAVTTVDVSSQLSGRIAEVFVNFNDNVKTGQPLARVDPEIYTARVNEARAALSVAKATAQLQKAALQRAKLSVENAQTGRQVTEAQLAAAQAKQDDTERDFQRNLKLSQSASVSDRELTKSRAQSVSGAADLLAMESQVKMRVEATAIAEAEVAMAEANLANAEAVVEQKQAMLDQAKLDHQRTEIRSPIDGVVIKRDVNPGQTVAVTLEAKTLFKIAQDLHQMEVRGRIDEADVGRLKVGQTVHFTVDAYPDQVFTGRVLQIRKSPEVVQNVVTYTAIVSAPNPDLLLLPGMTAVLRIVVSDTGETLKIPNQALRFRPVASDNSGKAVPASSGTAGTVWVLGNNGAMPVNVTLGSTDNNSTQVVGGDLHEGQQVIVGVATPQNRGGAFGLRLGF
jgi:HlyD family secretion protein